MRAKLPDFVAGFGADFYGLARATETVSLVSDRWTVPAAVDGVVPYRAGETMAWRIGG
jgi:dihydroorotase